MAPYAGKMLIQFYAFRECSWRKISAHSRQATWHSNEMIWLEISRALDRYAEPCMRFFQVILITVSFNRSFAFKGCSWWPIPAHPWCVDWHYNGMFEFTSSRAFVWYAELHITLSDQVLLPIWNGDYFNHVALLPWLAYIGRITFTAPFQHEGVFVAVPKHF